MSRKNKSAAFSASFEPHPRDRPTKTGGEDDAGRDLAALRARGNFDTVCRKRMGRIDVAKDGRVAVHQDIQHHRDQPGRPLRVADSVLDLANAGTSQDSPVTVPAPNF